MLVPIQMEQGVNREGHGIEFSDIDNCRDSPESIMMIRLELRNSLLSLKVSWQRREPEAFALLNPDHRRWLNYCQTNNRDETSLQP